MVATPIAGGPGGNPRPSLDSFTSVTMHSSLKVRRSATPDVHDGLRTSYYMSGQDYSAARDRCMGTLFEQIAKEHGVPVRKVYAPLGRNRGLIDLFINLPFA